MQRHLRESDCNALPETSFNNPRHPIHYGIVSIEVLVGPGHRHRLAESVCIRISQCLLLQESMHDEKGADGHGNPALDC